MCTLFPIALTVLRDFMPGWQGVLLPALGSIALQSGRACSKQHAVPVLHLTNSLGGRFASELMKLNS